MAILSGAVEAVRSHLCAGVDIDATDDKGRSPLILAAHRGLAEICDLLLRKGANPSLRDRSGTDARAVADARGHEHIVALLDDASRSSVAPLGDAIEQEAIAKKIAAQSAGAWDGSPAEVGSAPVDDSDSIVTKMRGDAIVDDDPLDLLGWEPEIEAPVPPHDPAVAQDAARVQVDRARHRARDTDETWDDVSIELPELADLVQRRVALSPDERRTLRAFLLAAIRDGCVTVDRLTAVVPPREDATEWDGDPAAALTIILGDLGIVVVNDPLEPDVAPDSGEADEDRHGDEATAALAFFANLQSAGAEPYARLIRDLPPHRLTHEDEIALGKQIENGMHRVMSAISSSQRVQDRLLDDAEAALSGCAPGRFSAHPVDNDEVPQAGGTGDANEEDDRDAGDADDTETEVDAVDLDPGSVRRMASIVDCCRRRDAIALAGHLSGLRLERGYLTELIAQAKCDPEAGDAAARIDRAQADGARAKRRLVEANLRLVLWVAGKYRGLSLMDRFQEGTIGLMRAADRYDYRRGFKFATYAIWWIRQSITRAVADLDRAIRVPVHVIERLRKIERSDPDAFFDEAGAPDEEALAGTVGIPVEQIRKLLRVPREPLPIDGDGVSGAAEQVVDGFPTPEEALSITRMQRAVRRHLRCLDPRQAEVLRLRFGFDAEERTLEEVGQTYGVTRERIRQIEAKAIDKLSHPARLKQLRDLLP